MMSNKLKSVVLLALMLFVVSLPETRMRNQKNHRLAKNPSLLEHKGSIRAR
jgi:hypothetical protein